MKYTIHYKYFVIVITAIRRVSFAILVSIIKITAICGRKVGQETEAVWLTNTDDCNLSSELVSRITANIGSYVISTILFCEI